MVEYFNLYITFCTSGGGGVGGGTSAFPKVIIWRSLESNDLKIIFSCLFLMFKSISLI